MFAEDEAVPVPVIAALWQATAGLNLMQSRARIRELHDLSPLSSLDSTSGGSITLHDIVRDYLRLDFLGLARLAVLHATAIDATAASLAPSAPPAASCSGPVVAWWDLPDGYLTDHLITHMIGAGRTAEAEELAGDLRWIESRVPGAQVDGLEVSVSVVFRCGLARMTRVRPSAVAPRPRRTRAGRCAGAGERVACLHRGQRMRVVGGARAALGANRGGAFACAAVEHPSPPGRRQRTGTRVGRDAAQVDTGQRAQLLSRDPGAVLGRLHPAPGGGLPQGNTYAVHPQPGAELLAPVEPYPLDSLQCPPEECPPKGCAAA
ncbi:hypothetical protein OG816_38410 [Streptomyces sp. NBC_00073]